MPNEEELEKGRFLTDTQGDYLLGNHDPPNDNAERQTRSKIRDRTVGAILDLQLVSKRLPKTDRELLFEYDSERFQLGHKLDEGPYGSWGELGIGMAFQEITHFFYKLLRENGSDKDTMVAQLERIAENAEHEARHGFEWKEGWTEHGLRAEDVEADFELNIVDNVDVERAKERFDRGIELSGFEMKALVESDEAELKLSK